VAFTDVLTIFDILCFLLTIDMKTKSPSKGRKVILVSFFHCFWCFNVWIADLMG
jgi:hypothetical protein